MAYTTALIMFGALTLLLLGIEIMFTYATKGFGYGFSSNRSATNDRGPLALRIQRAYQNQIESAAYGVPILIVAAITGLENSSAETAALIFVLGRAAFAVLYLTGIPFIRVPAFVMGTFSAAYIAYVLFSTGLI